MAWCTRSAATRSRSNARSGDTREQSSPLSLPVKIEQTGDKLTVTVPASKDEKGQAEVWLCPLTKSVPVVIGRGENSGQTITYTNVVRRWIKLGDWTGKAETFNVPVKDVQSGGVDAAAVVVQNGVASAPRLMLGAAQIAYSLSTTAAHIL